MARSLALQSFHPVRLADQAASALRETIQRNAWGLYLPAEHDLARQLGISRPTVHRALMMLAKDGVISIGHGRRTRILSRRPPSPINPTVCLVAPSPRHTVGLAENPLLSAIRDQLITHDVRWEEVFDAKLRGRNPDSRLRELIRDRRGMCWLLAAGSVAVQRWFEKEGLPALVLGSCQAGVQLPSVDWDQRAVGWHAAGNMVRLGHRHIALVLRDRPLPGSLACRDGVASYLSQVEEPKSLTVITAARNAAELQTKIERLLTQRPRPTVIFTMQPEHTQTVLMHLPRFGLRIPEDMSVMCSGTHPLFESSVPELTRYSNTTVRMMRHTVRVLRSLLAGHPASLKPFLIMPAFVAGKTLARVRQD